MLKEGINSDGNAWLVVTLLNLLVILPHFKVLLGTQKLWSYLAFENVNYSKFEDKKK